MAAPYDTRVRDDVRPSDTVAPARTEAVRHELAAACLRLADWIDNPKLYLQQPESGRVDWVRVR